MSNDQECADGVGQQPGAPTTDPRFTPTNTSLDKIYKEHKYRCNILAYDEPGFTLVKKLAEEDKKLLKALESYTAAQVQQGKIKTAKEIGGTIKLRKLTGDEITELVDNYTAALQTREEK